MTEVLSPRNVALERAALATDHAAGILREPRATLPLRCMQAEELLQQQRQLLSLSTSGYQHPCSGLQPESVFVDMSCRVPGPAAAQTTTPMAYGRGHSLVPLSRLTREPFKGHRPVIWFGLVWLRFELCLVLEFQRRASALLAAEAEATCIMHRKAPPSPGVHPHRRLRRALGRNPRWALLILSFWPRLHAVSHTNNVVVFSLCFF